jgi:hypothetical protein
MFQHQSSGTRVAFLAGVFFLWGSITRCSAQVSTSVPNRLMPQDSGQVETLQADPDPGRRREAARVLGQRGSPAVILALAHAAAFDAERNVRIAAGDAIALIRRRGAGNWVRPPSGGGNNLRDLVESWYQIYLRRPADPGGLRTQVDRLRRGAAPEEVQGAILGSDEYYQLQGGRPRAWVVGLYADVLDRSPAPREINNWMRTLDRNGGSREATATEFLRSARAELAQRR